MKNKIIKIISIAMITTMAFAFTSLSLAMTTAEFAEKARDDIDWFWDGVKKQTWRNKYFGKKIKDEGGAAYKKSCACIYHEQSATYSDAECYISNALCFEGNNNQIIIYGGKNAKAGETNKVETTEANGMAKMLYDAYDHKPKDSEKESTQMDFQANADIWQVVSHAMETKNSNDKPIKELIHENFYQNGRSGYSADLNKEAEKKYAKAIEKEGVEESNIKFEDTKPKITKKKHADGTMYTYIGPFKLSGSGTIKDIIVGQYSYSDDKKVKWSTSIGDGIHHNDCNITKGKKFYVRVEADINDETVEVKIKTKGGTYYEARMVLLTYYKGYHSIGESTQNLAIFRAKKHDVQGETIKKQVKNIGSLKIIKEDKDTKARLPGVKVEISGPNNYKKEATTDPKGEIFIDNLQVGLYTIRETENPHYGYTKMVTGNKEVEGDGDPTIITLENEKQTGNLKVIKVDEDTQNPLSKVQFKIKKKEDGKYVQAIKSKTIQNEVKGNIELDNMNFTNEKEQGTLFITDNNGNIEIRNLLKGAYILEEIKVPYYGYTELKNYEVTITRGTHTIEYTANNQKQTGNLRIQKVDPDTNKPLAGVRFKVKGPDGKYILLVSKDYKPQWEITGKFFMNEDIYVSHNNDEKQATEFITNDEGIIEIHNILLEEENNIYTVIETSVGDNNAYEIDDDYITWESNTGSGKGRTATIELERQRSDETEDINGNCAAVLTVKNKRKYIDLSGYVWHDVPEFGKDVNKANGLYQDNEADTRDRLIQGMVVQIKDENGAVIELTTKEGEKYQAETITDSNGSYAFQRVEIDQLKSCYIEFSYNGMSYQSVKPTIDPNVGNGSKAIEGTNRPQFNSEYETITKGQSNAHELTYDTSEEYKSKLLYREDGDQSKYNYGYEENKSGRGPVNNIDDQYMIQADTYQAYNNHYITQEGGIMSAEDIRENGETEIKNINLGIESREQIDLDLEKDLAMVQVGINGATHIYKYEDRYKQRLDAYNDLQKENSPTPHDPQVKFGEKNKTLSYTSALYASDVYYEEGTSKDQLQVKVTYKIGILTDSVNLVTTINEIEDYYDTKYLGPDELSDHVKVGTKIDEQGNITEELEKELVNSGSNDPYYKMRIRPKEGQKIEVRDQQRSYIYVQLEVAREQIIDLLENTETEPDKKLYNAAEITSYSTRKQNEETNEYEVYATIDKDAQPGNLDVEKLGEGDWREYEGDSDRAPGLQLVLQEERKIDGKVFVDSTSGELMSGTTRQGSGEYENR